MCTSKGHSNHEEKIYSNADNFSSESDNLANREQNNGARDSAPATGMERGRGKGTSGGISPEPTPCDPSLSLETGELVIGCKHPNGLVIRYNGQSLLLLGSNDMPKRSALQSYGSIGFTRVPRSFWSGFLSMNPEWLALQNGSVFVSDTQDA
ncbi:hypothetical protein COMNV_01357 [Commensalibacter sp. Nvir]|uniref:hypothetical protein n=1 Tax=Commensalibacter sp. Nvir TaxID=3069817 RepID=UPI002D301E0A|nr:hypothetical protein COMNV_01357 [Commensalibacter sp. Nvir]